jgi:ferritin-like metal-binding protein YciE
MNENGNTYALAAHLEQTKEHVRRIQRVFEMHGVEPEAVDCPAIDGILEEADDVAGEVVDASAMDAALAAAAQTVEH